MEGIIVYGSKYGTSRRYAEKLSQLTGLPAIPYQEASDLAGRDTIIYLGSLYAGGVLGMAKTLRGLALREGQRLIIVTVGLADPGNPKNREHIRASLKKQLSPELFRQATIFHLRGGIDYSTLTFRHQAMMALLCLSLRRKPAEQQSAEDRALLETYGKQVDFTDLNTLIPILQEIQGKNVK